MTPSWTSLNSSDRSDQGWGCSHNLWYFLPVLCSYIFLPEGSPDLKTTYCSSRRCKDSFLCSRDSRLKLKSKPHYFSVFFVSRPGIRATCCLDPVLTLKMCMFKMFQATTTKIFLILSTHLKKNNWLPFICANMKSWIGTSRSWFVFNMMLNRPHARLTSFPCSLSLVFRFSLLFDQLPARCLRKTVTTHEECFSFYRPYLLSSPSGLAYLFENFIWVVFLSKYRLCAASICH